ncbi:polyamine aminopropyltransferase [Ramlibacter sp. USB13]|uniref:Polyamine aminopropyltransferase n=1 Tax=Ramlibacter cellulosilyticus TaxID=2764187 RepID=A0A923MTY3_9BURK|nr:polyamine aminopropyltransferase [Ramlibacter cellulosilyticus]MBC5784589.1 polyamine aminopropyltransferase [Ramlibacter cellulosilyticus]
MQGLHLTADLFDCRCPPALLTSAAWLADLCRHATREAGLTVVGEHWHKFPSYQGEPGGVTGMLLLAESHLAVHTWPERAGVTLDVYVCNFSEDNSPRAEAVMSALLAAFAPVRAQRERIDRAAGDTPRDAEALVLEPLDAGSVYGFRFDRRLLSRHTRFQHLELFESPQLGRTLRLDGRFMTSEADEFFYHEALVHPAAIAHPAPAKVLILGGGDGGAAEEVLKHPAVEQVTLVDIDAEVVAVAREHLASIHRGALDDPRVRVLCEDGAAFVRGTHERYDLVLLDLTDPETPAGPLYTERFLRQLRSLLRHGGMVVLHLGAPFHEQEQVRGLAATLRSVFANVDAFGLHVPLYGAYWGFAIASQHARPAQLDAAAVGARLDARGIADLRFYNAQVHGALFALPTYFAELVREPAFPPTHPLLQPA